MKIIPYIAIIILICIILFRECGKQPPVYHAPNIDSIINHVRTEEREIASLNKISTTQAGVIYIDRHHYHTVRHDSLIPCETKLMLCDTIIIHDSIHDVTQDLIIAKQDSVINDWHKIHSSDSCEVMGLKKEVNRQKWQKRGIITAWIVREGIGLIK